MGPSRFDELTKALARSTSRRQALRAIAAAVGGLLGLGGVGTALANCKPNGIGCNISSQCCSGGCCHGTCTDLGTTTNCGACGHQCAAGQGCCGGTCTDLNTTQNCGACGHTCSAGQTCQNGQCVSPTTTTGTTTTTSTTTSTTTTTTTPPPCMNFGGPCGVNTDLCCSGLFCNNGFCCPSGMEGCPPGGCCSPGSICCGNGECCQP